MTRALLVALFVAMGCAGDPVPITNCTAGIQTACACPGGSQGAQRCAADGSGFGACMCEEADAGADVTVVADVVADRTGIDALQLDAADAIADTGPDRACPTGQVHCPGEAAATCIDTMTNPDHCGGCGRQCSAPDADLLTCTRGVCSIGGCRAGRRDCDGNYANGCEVLTVCGGRCSSAGVCPRDDRTLGGCEAGDVARCRCLSFFGDCDGDMTNGCETNISTDSMNCGACGNRCPTGLSCHPLSAPGSPTGVCRPT